MYADRSADILRSLYAAALAGADARAATERAVARLRRPAGDDGGATWLIALGKAAPAMAEGAVAALAAAGISPAGGVVVGTADGEPCSPPHPALRMVAGDHPVPGARSIAAADAIGDVARGVRADDRVLVLLSGGASALAAAPVDGVELADLARLAELLLASGLDVAAMNAVRKRFARWGAGRLAATLSPARVHCLVVSDVIGDPLAAIGSGPCVADPLTAAGLAERLRAVTGREHGETLWDALPPAMRTYIERTVRGELRETPKPDDAVFSRVTVRVILNNADALAAAATRAFQHGFAPVEVRHATSGEARVVGEQVVEQLVALRERCRGTKPAERRRPARACLIIGGETTVTLGATAGDGERGTGGRCQELALAAARALYALGDEAAGITVLAAGTDGRDGLTDAAGAIVDGATWERIRTAGHDPASDLARHDAYHALDAADALLRTGPTGTNVMDVVMAVVRY